MSTIIVYMLHIVVHIVVCFVDKLLYLWYPRRKSLPTPTLIYSLNRNRYAVAYCRVHTILTHQFYRPISSSLVINSPIFINRMSLPLLSHFKYLIMHRLFDSYYQSPPSEGNSCASLDSPNCSYKPLIFSSISFVLSS